MDNNDEIIIPHRMQVLGKALRPVLTKLEEGLDEFIGETFPICDMSSTLRKHIGKIHKSVRSLEKCANDELIANVIANETVQDVEIYQAVGAFKIALNRFLEKYHGVQAMEVEYDAMDAHDLLVSAYRNLLDDVHDWLRDVVEALEGSETASIRQKLRLTTTAASEIEGLLIWIECQPASYETVKSNSDDTLLAVAFGAWIGYNFFGGD
ncbi:hypothetical protein AGMMS49960_04150 [Betaproteobacteria bacterium]|nr:hypothetical protein AGMMS49543_05830 [Betaproteobacteria bacterium]GHT99286.1 hypothetical protein AGMMS49960_04150 [Betaproteobacteria bacterium]GHU23966.1 hypothetical protein AGMMS50243_26320 [Betaproteobacteria bacterium]